MTKERDLVKKIMEYPYYDAEVMARYEFTILDGEIVIKSPNFILYNDMIELLMYDMAHMMSGYKIDKNEKSLTINILKV